MLSIPANAIELENEIVPCLFGSLSTPTSDRTEAGISVYVPNGMVFDQHAVHNLVRE